jgi:hypothetical protein
VTRMRAGICADTVDDELDQGRKVMSQSSSKVRSGCAEWAS